MFDRNIHKIERNGVLAMTGAGVAAVVPPSQRAYYEAKAKETLERRS